MATVVAQDSGSLIQNLTGENRGAVVEKRNQKSGRNAPVESW